MRPCTIRPVADHPYFFTWGAQKDARPISLVGGEGAHFELATGERWLDLGSLIYQANLGHGNRRVIDAVKAQADRLCLAIPAADYPEKRELAERLLAKAPDGFDRVFFTLGGSDANENAIKIARMATGKFKLLARYRSYHGATMGAVSLTGDARRMAVEPGLPGVVHVSDFDCRACPGGVRAPDCAHAPLTHIPATLSREGDGVAAVFVESIVGANGVLIPPPGYMAEVREACDRHGALLVMDEVLVGFGRTGRFFALDHEGIVPDLITCGKAITGGYGTLGAVLVHERVSAHFDDRALVTGLTHYAHPLGVAAALETLRVIDDEGLVDRAAALEGTLRAGLERIVQAAGTWGGQTRCRGLLGGVELDLGAGRYEALKSALVARCVHAHLPLQRNILVIAPPLVIGEEELRDGLGTVADAVQEAFGVRP